MEFCDEIYFAQLLASNQNNIRNKTLRKVGNWFKTKSISENAFNEDGMMKIWKGLYYFFWHCDKPLTQEKLADVISNFIHVFQRLEYSFLYIDTCFQTLAREWYGIDRFRLEKYLMFIRQFLHQCFELLKKEKWKRTLIKNLFKVLKKTVMNSDSDNAPFGLKMHITDIYMEELARCGADELTSEMTRLFLMPYCHILIKSDNPIFLKSVSKDIFLYLINQDADEEEFSSFPFLKFDAESIIKLLQKFANKPSVKRKNRAIIYNIMKRFQYYKDGINVENELYREKLPNCKINKKVINKATKRLLAEESEFKEEKKSVKRQKHKIDVIDL